MFIKWYWLLCAIRNKAGVALSLREATATAKPPKSRRVKAFIATENKLSGLTDKIRKGGYRPLLKYDVLFSPPNTRNPQTWRLYVASVLIKTMTVTESGGGSSFRLDLKPFFSET